MNLVVGPDHALYVVYYDQSSPQAIRLRKSTDLGATFSPAVTVATLGTTGTNGDLGLNGGFRANAFPQAAVNPVNGHIYVTYNDNPAGPDGADVLVATSTDGGASFGAPVWVNDDATTNSQFFPTINVTPDGSKVGVFFYDRRLDPADLRIDYFGAIATDAGGTLRFSPNFRVTQQPFGVVIGVDPVINPSYMGDYDMVGVDNANFYPVWGDNSDFNPVDNRFNANIRTATVSVNAGNSPEVITTTPTGPTAGPVSSVGSRSTGRSSSPPSRRRWRP